MKWRIETEDFRASEWKWDAEKKQYFCVCEELVDGRWEGFVSIKRIRA